MSVSISTSSKLYQPTEDSTLRIFVLPNINTKMPSYTLNYFNQRGRAEVCRMLFAAAGVQYTDKRFELSEWNSSRSNYPCSMLPLLDIDSKFQIPQSMAMARYLAREYGFHGRSNLDMARVDYIADCFYDILDDYLRQYHDSEGRSKFQRSSEFTSSPLYSERRRRFQETCRRILPFMEKTLEYRSGGSQFFMGDQLTFADMMFYSAVESPFFDEPNFLSSYPRLLALRNRIADYPKFSSYFSSRRRTDF